ncbi:MAG: family containing protein [Acidobacteriaceae bacterium]|nr:family containing protein [Acidobacteriaceae bacterium]
MNRRNALQMMGAAAVVPFVTEPALLAATSVGAEEAGTGIYELRTYTAFPGKHAALLERFGKYEMAIFARMGMPGVGFWVPDEEPGKSTKLVYILRHKSRESAKENWARFQKDPEWIKVKAESEKNGVLVEVHDILFLDLLPFSPKV